MASNAQTPSITLPGFHLVKPLGRGGFAHVALYEQDFPRRYVAVKVLANAAGQTPPDTSSERFRHEVDTLARLSAHPSIVTIFDAGISAEGLRYLVLEYCPVSLGETTRRSPAQLQTVLDAGVRLASACESAHQLGILHRDVKPANVLLTATQRPVLGDFGIAQWTRSHTPPQHEIAFSLPWAAPEVLQQHSDGSVASEVWSLAATLYTFAAGRSPFEVDDRSQNTREKLANRILHAPFPRIPRATGYEAFERVLARAMHKDPRQRYPSMRDLSVALQNVQQHHGYPVTPFDVLTSEATPQHAPHAAENAPAAAHRTPEAPTPPNPTRTSRAERRAEMLAQSRGTDADGLIRAASPARQRTRLWGIAAIGVTTGIAIGAALWAILGALL